MSPTTCAVTTGASAPLGATVRADGVNFSVFAGEATRVDLLLFDDANASGPVAVIPLDRAGHCTGGYWHVFVPGVQPGQVYAYRAHGSHPRSGDPLDGDKVLLDPYGTAVVVPEGYNRAAATGSGGNAACAMKSVVAYLRRYDWEDDRPPHPRGAETVLYELHVRGFTRHPSSGVAPGRRGTYGGVIDKIPYLRMLGVTAVELLPVFQFDALDAPAGHVNYWGYPPVSFFAPHQGYASSTRPLAALDEFRDMVKALHAAGVEVIVDAMFSHTAEGGANGPVLCFRGLAEACYYLPAVGTGASTRSVLNASHPVVRRMILDSLRHWVGEMHVDGFRLTLPPAGDAAGADLPLLLEIASDPLLAGARIIWTVADAAERAEVMRIAGERWQYCDGRFEVDIRRFLKGDNGAAPGAAECLFGTGMAIDGARGRADGSVHFVTTHDGFTLNDLVTYNLRHNDANGEANHDGTADNASWNCGVEGPTAEPAIEALRTRQVKNFFALALLGAGTPMLLMGDEVRRSQGGNNNAWCQDNDVSWFDWTLLDRHHDVLRFVTALTALRARRDLGAGTALSLAELLRAARVSWHGVRLNRPDWSPQSHAVAFTLRSPAARLLFHGMVNAYWEPLEFELPPLRPRAAARWQRCLDTALPPPDDIRPWTDAPPLGDRRYAVQPRSVVLLALERHGRLAEAQVRS